MGPRDNERQYRNASLVLAAVDAFAALVTGVLQLRLPLLWALLLVLALLAGAAVVVALVIHPLGMSSKRFRDLLRSAIRLQLGALKWLLYGLPGVAVTLLAFGAISLSSGRSCAAPVDLRVLTAPENVTALTRAATRYVADRSGNGCRKAIVTVTAGSSIEDVRQGFAHGWAKPGSDQDHPGSASKRATYLGPRPDIWIPDTKLAAAGVDEFVRDQPGGVPGASGGEEKARLDAGPTISTSPMVVGVFNGSYGYDSRQGPILPSLTALLGGLRQRYLVSSHSRHEDEAGELISFLTDANAEKTLFACGGFAPTRSTAFSPMSCGEAAFKNDPDVPTPEQLRAFAGTLRAALYNARPRPITPYYVQFSETFRACVGKVLDRAPPSADTIANALNAALAGRRSSC